MQKLTKTKVNLDKFELIYASLYLIAGTILNSFVGNGITLLSMCIMMLVFTILLIVFFRQHVYGQDKPLLTALSIYYKSLSYMVVIFSLFNLPGRIMFTGVVMVSIIIYAVLSCIFGKKYNEVLNAYLYIVMIGFARNLFL